MLILNIFVCIVVLVFGLNLKNRFKSLNKKDHKILNQLFYFHLLSGIMYYAFMLLSGGDAVFYWEFPKQLTLEKVWADVLIESRPTHFMYLFNYFPSNVLSLSLFTGTLIYTIFGYWGILYLYLIIKQLVPNYQLLEKIKVLNVKIFPALLFLPNLHFWSSGTSKDTLLFFAILLFIYSIMNPFKWTGIIISLALSFSLRPHITLFLAAGFGIAFVLDGKLRAYQKGLLIFVFLISSSFIFSYVLSFAKIDAADAVSIQQFSSTKASDLSAGAGSGVDISGYPYPLKLATFLFRPLFFDIHNLIAVIASFENLFLIFLTLKFIAAKPIRLLRKSNYIITGSLIFFIIGSMAFALILGNLGIMLREKNMLFPAYFITLLYVLSIRYIKRVPTQIPFANDN